MDARAHHRERLVNRAAHVGESAGGVRVACVNDRQGVRLQLGPRELVSHVVVNLAGDAGTLGKRGDPHLVVLALEQVAVLGLQGKRALLELVSHAPVAGALALPGTRTR